MLRIKIPRECVCYICSIYNITPPILQKQEPKEVTPKVKIIESHTY